MVGHAKLVIIGAGIVGCGIAYHATQMGWGDDVVVLDQGPLFETGGSTSHAPGLVFQTNFSRTMTKFAQYTVKKLAELKSIDGGESCFNQVGGLEVAYTCERMEDLKRKLGVAMSWGVEARLVGPEEIKRMIPIIDESRILGGYYVSTDGIARAVRGCEAMARQAEARGARFYGKTRVTGIEIEGGRIRSVLTRGGRITADNVVLSAGIWGPSVGRLAGLTLPLSPVEHLYAQTVSLPDLHGETAEVVHPVLRHQDRSMYFRQHGSSYG